MSVPVGGGSAYRHRQSIFPRNSLWRVLLKRYHTNWHPKILSPNFTNPVRFCLLSTKGPRANILVMVGLRVTINSLKAQMHHWQNWQLARRLLKRLRKISTLQPPMELTGFAIVPLMVLNNLSRQSANSMTKDMRVLFARCFPVNKIYNTAFQSAEIGCRQSASIEGVFVYIPVGVDSQNPGSMSVNFCRRIEAVVYS